MASNSYQNEVPKARVNIRLDLHTGGAQQKLELPLKLMVTRAVGPAHPATRLLSACPYA